MMHVPEGSFKFQVGAGKFEAVLERFGGADALQEWQALNAAALELIQALATAIPPLALRCDLGLALTLLPHLLKLVQGAPIVGKVEGSFKDISKHHIKDAFLVSFLIFSQKNYANNMFFMQYRSIGLIF